MTKHFYFTLTIFIGMIALGLVGVYLVSYFNEQGNSSTASVKCQGENC